MTEFSVTFLVYITLYAALAENVFQMERLLMAEIGSDINLTCFCPKDQITSVMWLKQTIGEKPVVIATAFHYTQPPEFYKDFYKSRFRLSRDAKSFNLSISETQLSDSATYYCVVVFLNMVTFGEGTILIVKGKDLQIHTIQQQHSLILHRTAENITLECKILSNVSMGDHSVYWFRHGSGESQPGIIYTYGNSSGQCKKSSETGSPTQSCVYELPKKILSSSDSGTYYCAVAACGQILFGNGIKLEISDYSSDQRTWILIISISVFLLLSLIFNITLWRRIQRGQWNYEGNKQEPIKIRNKISEQAHGDNNLNYATVKFMDKRMKPRRKFNIKTEDETLRSVVYYDGLQSAQI
ncbi:uncharacterized protein LOC143475360 [Brachyhypopomus gauderio]|uniref:uncharacterized protein LOC143475360 n=1 Tax=Brachyhypopomus gauderio TaxID=698409 RepID=UPI0040411980